MQVDDPARHGLQRQVVQLRDALRATVQVHVVFQRADLGGTAWQHKVLRVDGIDHIERRKTTRLERRGVDVHHDRAHLAAIGQGHARALYGCKARADEVVAEIVKLLLLKRLAREGELQNRHRGGVVGDNLRRQDPRRQNAED